MNKQNLSTLNQIERIILLKIKTVILQNLDKSDIPEFEQVMLQNNPQLLLKFAENKIPELSKKISHEILSFQKQLFFQL